MDEALSAVAPGFAGHRVVRQPPLWDEADPERYTYALYDAELDVEQLLRFFEVARSLSLVNPRPIPRSLLDASAAYHPAFFRAMTGGTRSVNDAPGQLLHLRSRIFLAGCTLSAAIVQLRYSAATIRSKLRHLWIGCKNARIAGLDVDAERLERMIIGVATDPADDVTRLIALKDLYHEALRALFRNEPSVPASRLDDAALTPHERERFGFVPQLQTILGTDLRALVVYGSSVSSESFADYDVIAVVGDTHRALRMLSGSNLAYGCKPLNLAVYDAEGFRLYQLACGDNMDSNARCAYGEVSIVLKPHDALSARNFSFGYLRMRQLLGMAAHLAQSESTALDDRAELFEYFVKVPMHIYKGIAAVAGEPVHKERLRALLVERWDYDLERQRRAVAEGEAVSAMCRAFLATAAVLKDLGRMPHKSTCPVFPSK
ncbi:MAG: hypothetical protein JWM87_3366 [Candidatus Eremiobacteraeota bacterium]|nr:hypothetical protein [Candidatus Eremiobacteraeota bacterium]